MRKLMVVPVAAAAMLAATVPTAAAKQAPIVKSGTCSGAAVWKLKAKHDGAALEIEFEVDQNVAGRRWRVVLRRNGAVVFNGVRATRAPSGSFSVERRIREVAGPDRIVATARALGSGQTCRGAITL